MSIVVFLARCRAVLLLIVWLVLAAYLAFFAAHVVHMLAYPFPLDYGEGQLLGQIEQLRAGTPIWWLYADPAAPPFFVVNYPPVYLLLTSLTRTLTGNVLLAGRLISLLATLGSVVALGMLARYETPDTKHETRYARTRFPVFRLLVSWSACLLLTIPVVREWAGYLRVDALALSLGLWGLVVLRDEGARTKKERQIVRGFHPWSLVLRPLLAGLLLILAMYTKPSMVAAPVVGGMWWLVAGRASWPMRLLVLAGWAAFALVPLVVLQRASGGWFWVHVVTSNANRWDGALAWQFWIDQARLRWPLAVAGALGAVALLVNQFDRMDRIDRIWAQITAIPWWVPLLYTLVGTATAIGVGKVGAYANYFLELYAGLIWLACYGIHVPQNREPRTTNQSDGGSWFSVLSSQLALVFLLLSMVYYQPLWSRETLRVAGLLEPNPPQLFFRRSTGLWRETTREAEVLAAQARVQTAIAAAVSAAGGPIFTDMPGIAAQSGALTPFQAFEHRQLFDSGHWDQRPVLRDLANGRYPLAVIDFLGNWLTPSMIELITHRYAQDGAFGTFNMYRPVDTGSLHLLDQAFGDLRLRGYRLVAPDNGGATYSPGELLTLTLEWTRPTAYHGPNDSLEVVIQLLDRHGAVVSESTRPLLYAALPPSDWLPEVPIQHMQPFMVPQNMQPQNYTIAVGLHAGASAVAPQPVATVEVGNTTGRTFETGWNVPAPILAAWTHLGGIERAGLPLTPAVPFAWGRLQCFELLCLEQRGNAIAQRPLGEQQFLGETIRGDGAPELHEPFLSFWNAHGGAASLGPSISGEAFRNAYIVQWTRYARLERNPATGTLGLGRLGDDSLRLSPGMRYRWPSGSDSAEPLSR